MLLSSFQNLHGNPLYFSPTMISNISDIRCTCTQYLWNEYFFSKVTADSTQQFLQNFDRKIYSQFGIKCWMLPIIVVSVYYVLLEA